MKTFWQWTGLFLLVAAGAFVLFLLLAGAGPGYGWSRTPLMMGRGGCSSPLTWGPMGMGGHMGWAGGRMMPGMFLFPLIIVGLFVLGGILLANTINRSQKTIPVQHACTHCGKALQADWTNCPYCGEKV